MCADLQCLLASMKAPVAMFFGKFCEKSGLTVLVTLRH